MLVEFEILTALAMGLVLLVQRPGVHTPRYAAKRGQSASQQKRSEAARLTEERFGEEHPVARLVLFKAGGILLWVAGLAIVITAAPDVWNSQTATDAITGVGLAIQAVGAGLFVIWGLILSRSIARAVREIPADSTDTWTS
jgi:hypothetical protein